MSALESLRCFDARNNDGCSIASKVTFDEALLVLIADEKDSRRGSIAVEWQDWDEIAAKVFPPPGSLTPEDTSLRESAFRHIAEHLAAAEKADGGEAFAHFEAAKAWLAVAESEAKIKAART